MAYEGLDCKAATHLICLTNIRSTPWLMQAITRVMRHDDKGLPYEKQRAYLFVPNDPMMQDALKSIKARKVGEVVVDETDQIDDLLDALNDPIERTVDCDPITNKQSVIGEEQQSGSNDDDPLLSEDMLARIRMVKSSKPWAGQMNEIDFYKALRETNQLHWLEQTAAPADLLPPELGLERKTPRERETELRQQIEKLARKCDITFKMEPGAWNKKIHNAFRFKSRKEMGEQELKQVLEWLKTAATKEVEKRKPPVAWKGKNLSVRKK
jgi:hypothetical protein